MSDETFASVRPKTGLRSTLVVLSIMGWYNINVMTFELRDVRFTSAGQPSLELEGRLHLPAGPGPFPAVVVAHPHPLRGGSMETAVVSRIAYTLAERGWVVLRFNFRGVGGSAGRFDDGHGETDDLIGALGSLALTGVSGKRQRSGSDVDVDAGRLAVVGYSFGAWIAAKAVTRDDRVRAFVAVALPMGKAYGVDLSRFTHPKCFITGARDTVSPPELLGQYVGELPEPKILSVIPAADHFLLGYEQEVADQVAGFLLSSRL